MAKGLIEQESLTNIANAIRSKNGKTVEYTPAEMPEAIMNISGLDGFPIGGIAAYGGVTVPDGWLLCDGSTVSRELYSDLFKAVGTVFGEGDGSTTFNVPDYRDKFVLGAGGDVDLAETGGEKEVTLSINHIPPHNHTVRANIQNASGNDVLVIKNNAYYSSAVEMNTSATGGGQPHNNMPPYIGTYYIIKAKQSAGVVATVVDNLESISATDALSANQGKILNEAVTSIKGNFAYLSTDITADKNQNKQGFTYIKLPEGFTLDNTIVIGAMWADNEMFIGGHLASDMVSNLAYGGDYLGTLTVNLGDVAYMVGEEWYEKCLALYYYPTSASTPPSKIYVRIVLMKTDGFTPGEKISVQEVEYGKYNQD